MQTSIKNKDIAIWHVYYTKVQKSVTDNNNFNVYSSDSYYRIKRGAWLIEEVAEMVTAAHSGNRGL